MRLLDQGFRLAAGDAGQRDVEGDLKAKAALGARPEPDGGHDLGILRHRGPASRGQQLHGAEKAGCVAGGKKLLGINPIALASELLRPGELYLEPAVGRPRIAVAAADRNGACGVESVHRHEPLLPAALVFGSCVRCSSPAARATRRRSGHRQMEAPARWRRQR
jgi:hypothetical protein